MQAHVEQDGRIVVSLDRGDAIRGSLEGLAREHGIAAAKVSAIGGIEDPEIGWYELPARTFHRKVFPGIWELVSGLGNLTLLDGEPFLHLHVGFAGSDWIVRGGHLFDARCGVLMEVIVEPLATPLPRFPCAAVGLARIEPGGGPPRDAS